MPDAKHQDASPYIFCANDPLTLIDLGGENWFYYMAQNEEEEDWHWHEGNNITYINSEGKEIEYISDYEMLALYKITGINESGALEGNIMLYNQNKLVEIATDVFSGGKSDIYDDKYYDPIPMNTTFSIRLKKRDGKGPTETMSKDNPNPLSNWGIQNIPEEPYKKGGMTCYWRYHWGERRAYLYNEGITKNYYIHGKDPSNTSQITMGCVCDRSGKIVNYLWNSGSMGVVAFYAQKIKIPKYIPPIRTF